MIRKVPVLLLIAMFIFLFLTPEAEAQEGMSAEEAVKIVREKVEIPSGVEDFTSNYSQRNGRGCWDLHWDGPEEELRVSIDAKTGDFMHFHRNIYSTPAEEQNLLPAISEKEALDKAENFLDKAVSNKADNLELTETENFNKVRSRDYNFQFERTVNGLPFAKNKADVRISRQNGKIEQFNLRWDYDAVFSEPEEFISLGKVKNILLDKSVFELMYYRPHSQDRSKESDVRLVYGIKEPKSILIDAVNGEYIRGTDYGIPEPYAGGAGGDESLEKQQELLPIEREEIEKIEGLISQEEAVSAALSHFDLAEEFELDNARLCEDYREEGKRIWSLTWRYEKDGQFKGRASAAVNAEDGELYSFSKNLSSDEDKDLELKYSLNEARDTAEEFIKNIQPEKSDMIRYEEQPERVLKHDKERYASFRYTRLVNDVPFYEDGFEVTVDRATGEVTSYSMDWADFVFPEPADMVERGKALDTLLEVNQLKLGYVKPSTRENEDEKIGVYYYFKESAPKLVDALNGSVLDNNCEEYEEKQEKQFTDISGHPAEEDIKLLMEMGIIDSSSEKYLPEKEINNAEFIKMLVLANDWSPGEGRELERLAEEKWYAPYYQTAVYRGIISREDLPEPDQRLSRIFSAKIMLKAMGLSHAADLEGIYKVPADDDQEIDIKDKGYAAISLKMGLLKDVDGKFSSLESLTRAQAAETIVEYMKNAKR